MAPGVINWQCMSCITMSCHSSCLFFEKFHGPPSATLYSDNCQSQSLAITSSFVPLHGKKMHLERVVTDGDFIFANVYASGFFVLFKGFYSFVRIFLFASSLIGYCVHHQVVCSCSCQTARTGGSNPARVGCSDRPQIEDVQHTHLLGDRQEPRAQHDLGLEKQIVPVRV